MQWFAAGSGLGTALLAASAFVLACPLLSCTDGGGESRPPGPACANAVAPAAACTPLYEPSYDNVFARTLKPTCAKSGVSCHASTGRQGGLSFEDAEEAYGQLLDTTQTARPGDPSCSVLVARVVATDGNFRMPPGRSIDPGEQCAIALWIANGAKR